VDDPEILLTMTIELSETEKDQILVYENDDPELIAYLFGKKHGLNRGGVKVIEENIKRNVGVVV